MIYGIGTDIVQIVRIKAALERHGDRFARRILADEEWLAYQSHSHPIAFLAKRFAAKEATVKAMGTGFRDGITLAQIEVVNNALGRPALAFHAQAARFVDEAGIGDSHVSLSDEKAYAIAFVTLMQTTG